MIPFSLLDLSPIGEGESVSAALENSRRMAIKAEEQGYNRIWLAEHHGMPGIASAATSLVIAHVGAATKHIRVGSGGIMLPNHSPLVIAEQFGTLAGWILAWAAPPERICAPHGRCAVISTPVRRISRTTSLNCKDISARLSRIRRSSPYPA